MLLKYFGKNRLFELLIVLILIMISGSPGIYKYKFLYPLCMLLIIIYTLLFKRKYIDSVIIKQISLLSFVYIFICVCHFFFLGMTSWLGLLNNIFKMYIVCFVIYSLKGKFKYVYYEAMFIFTFIGLFFWIVYLSTGFSFNLNVMEGLQSIIIWSIRTGDIRNCGPTWEPGTYAGYLILIPLFFLNDVDFFKRNKFKTIILTLGLLSSMSTTGYVAFIIYLCYLTINSRKRVVLFPLVILLGVLFYQQSDILGNKIGREIERAENMSGEYHGQRFAVLLFDLHYIKKHPLIGNGFIEETRYADHLFVAKALKDKELAGHGNGFTNMIASMGLITLFSYLILIYRKNRYCYRKVDVYFYLFMICLLLNGEQFLLYPIFLGLPFLSLKNVTL